MSLEGRFRLIFIKYFSFVSELSGTDFFYKYNLNSQMWCLPVCACEDWGRWKPDFQEVPTVPPFKQTNKQNRTKFEFEKDKYFIEKCVDFQEFRGFSNLERNFDFDVIREKQCLRTKMSWFWPAGLNIWTILMIYQLISLVGPRRLVLANRRGPRPRKILQLLPLIGHNQTTRPNGTRGRLLYYIVYI